MFHFSFFLFFFFTIRYPHWNFSRLILGHIENFIESLGKMMAERDIFPADDFIVKCCMMCLIFSVGFIGCLDVLRAPKPSCSVGECRPLDLPHCGSLGYLLHCRVKASAHSRQQTGEKLSFGFASCVVKEPEGCWSLNRSLLFATWNKMFWMLIAQNVISVDFLYQ